MFHDRAAETVVQHVVFDRTHHFDATREKFERASVHWFDPSWIDQCDGNSFLLKFARRFLDEWLKSPPHRDNMAFANYDHAGVGAAVNGDTVYVALLFSTDLGLPPPKMDGPASTVTKLDSPAAAATVPAGSQPPPLRLRGTVGTR